MVISQYIPLITKVITESRGGLRGGGEPSGNDTLPPMFATLTNGFLLSREGTLPLGSQARECRSMVGIHSPPPMSTLVFAVARI